MIALACSRPVWYQFPNWESDSYSWLHEIELHHLDYTKTELTTRFNDDVQRANERYAASLEAAKQMPDSVIKRDRLALNEYNYRIGYTDKLYAYQMEEAELTHMKGAATTGYTAKVASDAMIVWREKIRLADEARSYGHTWARRKRDLKLNPPKYTNMPPPSNDANHATHTPLQ